MFTSERIFESYPGTKHRKSGNLHLQRSVKRCIDLLGAGILIVALFPVLIVIGLLVVLDDVGQSFTEDAFSAPLVSLTLSSFAQ